MAKAEEDDDLASEIETTDKYRSRSKSVATLTAAAAGALAAGLVLNPALVAFPLATQVLGLVTIVLLIFATAAFVIASVLHAADEGGRSWLFRFIRPWEASFSSADEWPSTDEYRKAIESVQRQIMRMTDLGMWLSTIAIASLVASLVSMLVINEERVSIEASLVANSPIALICPSLSTTFDATVKSVELNSRSTALTLEVDGNICRKGLTDRVAFLTVLRTDIILTLPT